MTRGHLQLAPAPGPLGLLPPLLTHGPTIRATLPGQVQDTIPISLEQQLHPLSRSHQTLGGPAAPLPPPPPSPPASSTSKPCWPRLQTDPNRSLGMTSRASRLSPLPTQLTVPRATSPHTLLSGLHLGAYRKRKAPGPLQAGDPGRDLTGHPVMCVHVRARAARPQECRPVLHPGPLPSPAPRVGPHLKDRDAPHTSALTPSGRASPRLVRVVAPRPPHVSAVSHSKLCQDWRDDVSECPP